jgi:hypothetical protein
MFGEWYQKTNKTEDTNKITLLAFKIIAILHNTLLATFIKLLETVSKGLVRNRSQNHYHTFLDCETPAMTANEIIPQHGSRNTKRDIQPNANLNNCRIGTNNELQVMC